MSQLVNNRKNRAIRRGIAVILVLVVLPAAYLIYNATLDRTPAVRSAVLANGVIKSIMTITTVVRPGDTQETYIGQQLVKAVLVHRGDQVKKGDPLITFDLTELADNLKTAQDNRATTEAAIQTITGMAAEQSANSQETLNDLQTQLSRLSSGLTGTTNSMTGLLSANPVEIAIDQDLAGVIAAQLAAIDPSSPDAPAQVQALLDTLVAGIQVGVSADYQSQLDTLSSSVSKMNSAMNGLTGVLTDDNALAGLLGAGTISSQMSSLSSSAQSALAAALQAEKQAQLALDNSVEVIYADFDGIVAEVNAEPGEYAGTASASVSSLTDLLGGSAGTSSIPTASGDPVIIIYDNTHPKAFFQANRYDASRLAIGMPVTYTQDDRIWNGKITYKGRIASNVALTDNGSSNSNLFSSMTSSVSTLSSEPKIDLEMSIIGQNLTDLTLGFNLDAEVQTASASDVLLLPAEAIKKELGEYYCFVISADNHLQRRVITLGIQSDIYAQALTGVAVGEKVVLSPTNDLSDGLLVRETSNG